MQTPKGVLSKIFHIFNNVIFAIKWYFKNLRDRKSDSLACLVGKTAIVTGGSSGLGFSTSVLLASRGCRVIIACRRNCEKEIKDIVRLTRNDNIIWKPLDLSSLKSTREFAEGIKKSEKKIDILINNAGISLSKKCTSDDGLNFVMQTNVFGPFLLTHLLIELLKASTSPKIIFLSSVSVLYNCLSLKSLNWKYDIANKMVLLGTYANSKACAILMAQEFAEKLKEYGIRVNSADPGISFTPIFDAVDERVRKDWIAQWVIKAMFFFLGTNTTEGAQTMFHLATKNDPKIKSGDHYFKCEPFDKPDILYDRKFCEEIWREIERLVRLNDDEKL